MEQITYIASIILLIVTIMIAVTFYRRRKKYFSTSLLLNENLNVFKLGKLEGEIDNLTEVIVIADRIEKPESTLLTSVKNNLLKGVKYNFLISKSNYQKEQEQYFLFFKAIANINNLQNQLEINPLLFDWNEHPYIFYRTKNEGEIITFAYMGTQLNEGIADNYKLIEPQLAKTIARIVNEASKTPNSQPVFNSDEFKTKVIPLAKAV